MKKLLTVVVVLALLVLGAGLWLKANPEALLAYARDAERGKAGVEQKAVLINGESYPYLEGGSGPTILMLHGFSGDKDNWTRFAQYFTGDYHVVIPDLPGFGESARHPDWSYDLISQRERLKAFVAALDLSSFHVIGNSMGGHLAGLYAHAYPQQVRSIGFVDNAGVSSPQKSEMTRRLEQGENPLLVDSAEDFDRMLRFVFVEPPKIPGSVKEYLADKAVEHRAFNAKIFEDYRGKTPLLEPLLPELNQPALVLWGDTDRLIDVSTVGVMQEKLPNPQVVIMRDCGHSPMIERPQETAEHYRAFLDQAA